MGSTSDDLLVTPPPTPFTFDDDFSFVTMAPEQEGPWYNEPGFVFLWFVLAVVAVWLLLYKFVKWQKTGTRKPKKGCCGQGCCMGCEYYCCRACWSHPCMLANNYLRSTGATKMVIAKDKNGKAQKDKQGKPVMEPAPLGVMKAQDNPSFPFYDCVLVPETWMSCDDSFVCCAVWCCPHLACLLPCYDRNRLRRPSLAAGSDKFVGYSTFWWDATLGFCCAACTTCDNSLAMNAPEKCQPEDVPLPQSVEVEMSNTESNVVQVQPRDLELDNPLNFLI